MVDDRSPGPTHHSVSFGSGVVGNVIRTVALDMVMLYVVVVVGVPGMSSQRF